MKGFGVTRVGSKEPVNENTLFMIGSNTKAFTATTIAILQEEGKVSLYDKVQKWMPEFKLRDPLASNDIIIADLMSHRIGFETFQGDFTYWDW
jgi:CubicO group peptidase (beta-lactamase class C family)